MTFNDMLSGGNPRTLGQSAKAIELVLTDSSRLKELMDCIFSGDEIVRMRASDALEKLSRQKPEWFKPFVGQLLNDWPTVRQPSVQWHLAQMLSEVSLSKQEKQKAILVLKNNLEAMDDWIVTNLTLESLATFARDTSLNRNQFKTILYSQLKSRHKSVRSRVNKLLLEFGNA